jgi:hypothetical protein
MKNTTKELLIGAILGDAHIRNTAVLIKLILLLNNL